MTTTPAIDRTLVAIRERGGRVTDQRRAMLHVLFEQSDLVTADDLAVRVQSHLPDMHISTVYRFLDALESLGLVTHVHLGHGAAAYHLTEGRPAHVVCTACGRAEAVDAALLAAWSRQLTSSNGFELVDQHFAFAGRCAGCTAQQAPSRHHYHR